MLEKNLLFYQGNFDPEVNRLIKAIKEGDQKNIEIFKDKTLKIVQLILDNCNSLAAKEEWSVVHYLVKDIAFLTKEELVLLSKYGIPFSNKYMAQFMI